jgi:hypothetical protein
VRRPDVTSIHYLGSCNAKLLATVNNVLCIHANNMQPATLLRPLPVSTLIQYLL